MSGRSCEGSPHDGTLQYITERPKPKPEKQAEDIVVRP